MIELIGFIIGLLVLALVIWYTKSKIIYFGIAATLVIALLAYLISYYLKNKYEHKENKELTKATKEYHQLKREIGIPKDALHTYLKSFTDAKADNLIVGEIYIWLKNGKLYVFPDYPTSKNYLLYKDDLKPLAIPVNKITLLEYRKNFLSKKSLLLLYDNKNHEDLELDLAIYDKLKELLK